MSSPSRLVLPALPRLLRRWDQATVPGGLYGLAGLVIGHVALEDVPGQVRGPQCLSYRLCGFARSIEVRARDNVFEHRVAQLPVRTTPADRLIEELVDPGSNV